MDRERRGREIAKKALQPSLPPRAIGNIAELEKAVKAIPANQTVWNGWLRVLDKILRPVLPFMLLRDTSITDCFPMNGFMVLVVDEYCQSNGLESRFIRKTEI